MSTTDIESWEGRVLAGQFRIEEPLGKGGMGVVYRATQMGMDRTVVVKVMHHVLCANKTAVERFRREAQSVGKLNHPNIVQVYMFGEAEDGSLFIAMEYVAGRSLSRDLQQHGPMGEGRVLRIADQILSALAEAHGVDIIHRDLKPDNIMLIEREGNLEQAKVLDFGLAKVFRDIPKDKIITQAGVVTGTPRYMSPEQARGLDLDTRTDLYSLGVVLYEAFTGKHPFKGESALDFMRKHTTEVVPSPRDRVEGLQLTPRTESLLMKCLAKEPKDRFRSAPEMQREVRTILRGLPAVRPDPSRAPWQFATSPTLAAATMVRRGERRRLVTAVLVLAATTLVLLAAVLVMFIQSSNKGGEAPRKASQGEMDASANEPNPRLAPAAGGPPVLTGGDVQHDTWQ